MFLPILLVSIVFMGLSLLGLGLQTFFSNKRKFPNTHIGHNKSMRDKGIYCARTQQKMLDKGIMKGQKVDPIEFGCSDSCGE